jgi:hypothetical protein
MTAWTAGVLAYQILETVNQHIDIYVYTGCLKKNGAVSKMY